MLPVFKNSGAGTLDWQFPPRLETAPSGTSWYALHQNSDGLIATVQKAVASFEKVFSVIGSVIWLLK